MKQIFMLLLTLFLCTAPTQAWWGENKQKEIQIQQVQQQLTESQRATGKWQMVAGGVAIGAIVLFVAGTALGSSTRRHGPH